MKNIGSKTDPAQRSCGPDCRVLTLATSFVFVFDCADLSESAVAAYAEGVMNGGGWRQRACRTVA